MLQRYLAIPFVLLLSFFLIAPAAQGCVGRILYIGSLDTNSDKILAELLVVLINERTGTNVKLRYFDDNQKLYDALKSSDENEKVDIIVEDTISAAKMLNFKTSSDLNADYAAIKDSYEKKYDLVWLNPFAFKNLEVTIDPSISSALIRRDILTNFPLLPRVINKLAGAVTDATYMEMLSRVNSGEKPNNVAKDFLRTTKLI